MQIRLALPKGRLQSNTADLLKEAGFDLNDYNAESRSYRPRCSMFPDVFFKVFHEKDIAVQVAIGNYDLGICGLDWIEEHLVKYTSEALVKIRDLGYGMRTLHVLAPESGKDFSFSELRSNADVVRIVSEYPNLAESFALKNRLRGFRIFPVWGAAGSYPPENADLAVMPAGSAQGSGLFGLSRVATLLEGNAYLIANRESLEKKDLSRLLSPLCSVSVEDVDAGEVSGDSAETEAQFAISDEPVVSLALPDGHQQSHTVAFLNRAGIKIEGYEEGKPTRRPKIDLEGFGVKVIRPQDMPFQVANGNFDLAITGRDWLWDHLSCFPGSPVKELVSLEFGRVRIVAVVAQKMAVSSIDDFRKVKRDSPLRLASEYVNMTDRYARTKRLAPYKVIPTWGASEAFLPEDADILIENTETGSTLSRHKLKIIDTLLESTACLIVNTDALKRKDKKGRISRLAQILRQGVEANAVL
ncbi:ATP phosphoribosyltransferase [Chloroflexota bacterium]